MFSASDHQFMALALQQAMRGMNSTSPNPRVGCVIVHEGRVVGTGAHLKAGDSHAEVFALQQAGAFAKGATAYVTLEPCSHYGRTPPCAEALVQAGVARVVLAMQDPNPLVAGQGSAYLRIHGIQVEEGLMEQQAVTLNAGFISRMTRHRPYVRSKIAASLDGRTALSNQRSQWITSQDARLDVQHWRARSCAIMTGIGTVLSDNPQLNVRDIQTDRQPMRIVIDRYLSLPLDARVLSDANVLVCYADDIEHKAMALISQGVGLFHAPDIEGNVCLLTVMQHLAGLQVNELLIEAGQGLNGSLLSAGLIDELLLYYAPKLMGNHAYPMFRLPEFTHMEQAIPLEILETRQIGPDIRIIAKVRSQE